MFKLQVSYNPRRSGTAYANTRVGDMFVTISVARQEHVQIPCTFHRGCFTPARSPSGVTSASLWGLQSPHMSQPFQMWPGVVSPLLQQVWTFSLRVHLVSSHVQLYGISFVVCLELKVEYQVII